MENSLVVLHLQGTLQKLKLKTGNKHFTQSEPLYICVVEYKWVIPVKNPIRGKTKGHKLGYAWKLMIGRKESTILKNDLKIIN